MDSINSPFIVPVAGCAMVLGIVIASMFFRYHTNRLRSEERMTLIAKGLPVPAEPDSDRPFGPEARLRVAHGIRTGGIVCAFVGIGLILFSFALTWILHEQDVLAVAAAGLIPFSIGAGLLVDYRLRANSLAPGEN
ncbi:MAG TPA: DUF6249 domain-containing protein [Acidobacteriaceae bacterium]|nr:DUF6249 domain-containing protein [Acidobacteriaceae bacterium]